MMSKSYLILLVEDNESDEVLALRAIAHANKLHRVDVARDGLEAVEYLTDPAKPCPDLVLLDLKLPKLNGHEVLKRIRADEKTRRVQVVVLSSSNEQRDVVGCFDHGAQGFVRKSVDLTEYMDKVAKLTEYWLTVNEPCLPKPIQISD